jgi:hypothetical protein
MKKPKPRNYINNRQLFEEIVAYQAKVREHQANGLPPPEVSRYIGLAVMEIAKRLASKSNFAGYSFRDEMVADGIEVCFKYAISAFNPEKTQNPFTYFTTSMYNVFVKRINLEAEQQYLKYKNYQQLNISDVDLPNASELNEITQDFIRRFEEKKLKKKKPASATILANTLAEFLPDTMEISDDTTS